MTDQINIQKGHAVLTTEEGGTIKRPEKELVEMIRQEILPPLNGNALPDGVKFVEWRNPYMILVHQMPPHLRQLRWITEDSPAAFGPGTEYRKVRLSIPYAVTVAVFYLRGGRLFLTDANELYFRNAPLHGLDDDLGFPALLNISRIERNDRCISWICTQYLKRNLEADWSGLLEALLNHTWNGAFNRSSEHHEGASWYGASEGIHPDLHPIEKWVEATNRNETFALSVPWKPAPLKLRQLMEGIFNEQTPGRRRSIFSLGKDARPPDLVVRYMNFIQKKPRKKVQKKLKLKTEEQG